MNLIVEELPKSLEIAATMAEFGMPITETTKRYTQEGGFGGAATRAVGCLGWIWRQWLAAAPAVEIRTRVDAFVERGMEVRKLSPRFEGRALHELYLIHCAIFASNQTQLKSLAEQVIDASGLGGRTPEQRFGELYASAWCGMLKYWILGDRERAVRQSEVIWGAYRADSFGAAAKSLVTPWLKEDWKSFLKCQKKDFERLWARSRKDDTVKSENGDEIVVSIRSFSIPQLWCWAHCGLALLAYRQGVEVATDPLWFPPHALKVVPKL